MRKMPATIRTYKTIIADDNKIDRLTTLVHAKQYPFLAIEGVYSSADEVLEKADLPATEVLLLDIDMPGTSGLELRKQLGDQHVCIFITSFPDYAVEGFQLAALDFLVKPFDKERFALTMTRLEDYLILKEKATLFECSLGADSIFIKEGHEQVKIQLKDILYLEALKDYTRIVTAYKKFHVLSVLGNLLQQTGFGSFIRIHRSYAVQKHFIDKVTPQGVFIKDIQLPVGRSYKPVLDTLGYK